MGRRVNVDPTKHCGLYLPGHNVHWIQAKLAAGNGSHPETGLPRPPVSATLIGVASGGIIEIDVSGTRVQLWNHDTEKTSELGKLSGTSLQYLPGFHLLRIQTGSDTATRLFCVVPIENPRRVCPSEAPSGSLVDLLKEAGGFSIPGRDVLQSDGPFSNR